MFTLFLVAIVLTRCVCVSQTELLSSRVLNVTADRLRVVKLAGGPRATPYSLATYSLVTVEIQPPTPSDTRTAYQLATELGALVRNSASTLYLGTVLRYTDSTYFVLTSSSSTVPPTCVNGKTDTNEQGVDCGGHCISCHAVGVTLQLTGDVDCVCALVCACVLCTWIDSLHMERCVLHAQALTHRPQLNCLH